MLGNGAQSFGLVSRALHWTIAIGVLGMLGFGSYLDRMQVSMANLWLFGLHKSIGLTLLVLVALRLLWHLISPPPPPLDDGVAWHGALARWTHRLFYVLLLAVPLTGWIASSASGIDTLVFGRWVAPSIAPESEQVQDLFFALHGALTKLLAALIVLHVAGALRRRDGTLRRMLRGSPAQPPSQ